LTEHQNSRPLIELKGFGVNPGNLRSWLYLPSVLAPKTPLVVVLHGCTQTAAAYDHGSGWTQLAEKNGFAVLFPEQQRANNANLCFNWFQPEDTQRGTGEALSVREMIGHVVEAYGIDQGRVSITGLSAGGAMAHVMLATYPELFSGGAIIGGLPYGVADSVDQAFQRMQGRNAPSPSQLRAALSLAAATTKALPKISVWHGTHDQTVRPVNAMQIIEQWSGVHAVGEMPDVIEAGKGFTRKAWLKDDGSVALELNLITGMGHGVPLATGTKDPLGDSGPHMLATGVSSTARIARTWGLADDRDVADAEEPVAGGTSRQSAEAHIERAMAYASQKRPAGGKHDGTRGIEKTITDALRAAGLMR
jgi:poly(hydroxyalkanoate) depolymerase family esterase